MCSHVILSVIGYRSAVPRNIEIVCILIFNPNGILFRERAVTFSDAPASLEA